MTTTNEARGRRSLSFAEAYGALRQAQKSSRGAPAYSRWVNRPAGRVLASAAYRLGMTPNEVTAVSAVFSLTGIGVIAAVEPSPLAATLCAGLLLIGFALDSADGQLARLTGLGRPSGEWLDHVVDSGKVCLLHGAVAMSWVKWGTTEPLTGDWRLLIPIGFLTVTVVSYFAWLLADSLVRIQRAGRVDRTDAGEGGAQPQAAPPLRSWLLVPRDYGTLALTFFWFWAPVFALTYSLLFIANGLILAASLPRWYRQVREAEGQAG
jgi:phosphatidylglycerophosphate synthase